MWFVLASIFQIAEQIGVEEIRCHKMMKVKLIPAKSMLKEKRNGRCEREHMKFT